jgi:hypothetical protein
MYSEDNDRRYPPADRWEDALATRSIKGDSYVDYPRFFDRVNPGNIDLHYAFREEASSLKASLVAEPASFILIFDTWKEGPSIHYYKSEIPHEGRHAGILSFQYDVVAFADGHVKPLQTTNKDGKFVGSQLDRTLQADHGVFGR